MWRVEKIVPDASTSFGTLQHDELLSKPALRGEHPVFRGDGLSGSIEASVAMHGFFLYAVFFNGSLAALSPGEASCSLSIYLSFSLLLSTISLYLLPHPLLANLRAFFPPRGSRFLLLPARPPRSLLALLVTSSSACLLPRIAVLCSPFPRVSRKAKWSFCSAFTAGARGREAYNFLGVFIAG